MRRPINNSTSLPRAEIRPGIWLDGRRAVWFAAERLLALADLHWGYAASHRARGNLLPVWGDDQIEACLRSLITDYAPTEMLWLGDIVHAAEGAARAEAFIRACPVPLTILAGNHDRRWLGAGDAIARRGRFFFHHGHEEQPVPGGCVEVIGHHHPAVAWSDGAGTHLKLPALIASERRLVLPAFSPWAAGTEWVETEEAGTLRWAIASTRIFAVPARARRTIVA